MRLMRGMWAVMLASTLAPGVVHATVLLDVTDERVVALADSVVVGTVTGQRAVRRAGKIYTETTVAVSRALHGPALAHVVITQLGGELDGVAHEVVGDARLRVGDEVALLTRVARDGRRYLVGMSRGVFRLRRDHWEQQVDTPLLSPRGTLTPPPGRRTYPLEYLEDLVRRVHP